MFSLNQLNNSIKKALFVKILFLWKIFSEKLEEILIKQFFSTYLSKMVGKNLIMLNGVGYLGTSRKFFKLGT